MVSRLVGFGLLTAVAVGAAIGGLWWQSARAAAQERAVVLTDIEVELRRENLDRNALAQLARRLDALTDRKAHPDLFRARANVALALRLPEDAVRAVDDLAFAGQAVPEDALLGARAFAARHAMSGRGDDAGRAAKMALEYFDSQRDPSAALLAWQCATRIEDSDLAQSAAAKLASALPESWEAKVVAALMDFDPQRAGSLATLRTLQQEGRPIAELDLAIAMVELGSEEADARERGVAAVKRVLELAPASKPARIGAVLAADRAGDAAARAAHLRWLLENYPHDERASKWQELLELR